MGSSLSAGMGICGVNMSYYRYITGIYKSYRPELNRTLRSSSVPRHVPQLEPARYTRSSSVPPSTFYSQSYSARPFQDQVRALSVPRDYQVTNTRDSKVSSYMRSLEQNELVRSYVSKSHSRDYLYPVTMDMLGSWKHYNISSETLNYRNMRAKSPIVTRELDRYVGVNTYSDFRHYNYRPVPYFGGSDGYSSLRSNAVHGRRRL